MQVNVLHGSTSTTNGIKKLGTHKISENGHCIRLALDAHPTHIHFVTVRHAI
jgi:hypothetical protein